MCLDEIYRLKQENEELKNLFSKAWDTLTVVVHNQKELLTNEESLEKSRNIQSAYLKSSIANLKYEYLDPREKKDLIKYPLFYDIDQTIDMIINRKASMARFGDGEFSIMSGLKRHKFQLPSEEFRKRLCELINVEEQDFFVGIADNYGSLEQYNEDGKRGIRLYMTDEVRREHWKYLKENYKYHNAYISRPYALYADNMTEAPKIRFEKLKKIWDKRNVVFVEGTLTRLGVGNDLFDNACSIKRILIPAENAFDKYSAILNRTLFYEEENILFLIAAAPMAGVLAYDLYKKGYQAIDIGHLDLEYEWYLNGEGKRSVVKHKYNNEMEQGNVVEDIRDAQYLREILCQI